MSFKKITRNIVLLLLLGVLSLSSSNVRVESIYANGGEDLPIHPIELYSNSSKLWDFHWDLRL